MSNGYTEGATGGITFAAPAFSFGNTQAGINSGYSFDLPLATVQAFQNSALSFTQNNAAGNKAFLNDVTARSQSNVTATADRAYQFQERGLDTIIGISGQMQDTLKYAVKKRTKGCFITTAICEFDGKPDDCEELATLRGFRDGVLLKSESGAEMVKHYYDVAPAIVAALNRLPESERVSAYTELRDQFLRPCLEALRAHAPQRAVDTYAAMVNRAAFLAQPAIAGGKHSAPAPSADAGGKHKAPAKKVSVKASQKAKRKGGRK